VNYHQTEQTSEPGELRFMCIVWKLERKYLFWARRKN
jgi:hypothetical protein